jgi:hypothetical protein
MRTFAAFWITCSLLSVGSFCVLLAEDRRLGVALPYSVPLAFAAALAVAPLLLLVADRFRVRMPAESRISRPAARVHPTRKPIGAQGVVLLDLSRATARPGRAA